MKTDVKRLNYQQSSNRIQLMSPKYWPTWFGVAILYLLSKLPYRVLLSIGRSVGHFLYFILPRRRRIAQINIERCFPDLTTRERRQLVKKNFQSVGIALMETAMSWWWPDDQLKQLVQVTGMDHVQKALSQGRGILLLGAHFTTLDIVGRLAGLLHPIHVVYRFQTNPVIDYLLRRFRDQGMVHLVDHRKSRRIIKALQQNNVVWYACDQDQGTKRSVFAPFFGIETATLKSPMRMAEMTNCAVMLFTHYRKADNSGYQFTVHPAFEPFPSGDDIADATQINNIIEQAVAQHPEQYLWLHRRFKSRPEGEKDFYE